MATSLLPKGSVKPQRAGDSIRGKTVSMVENHLNKQRSAYDQWIAELCRDAEESAMERDRLKAMGEGGAPPPDAAQPPSAWGAAPPAENPYAPRANTAPAVNPYAQPPPANPNGIPQMPPGLAPLAPTPTYGAYGAAPMTPSLAPPVGSPTSPPGLEGFQVLPPGEYYFRPTTASN